MDNDFLYSQLIKLGDMMGDGLHYEEPWISKEYSKISKLLFKNDPEFQAIKRDARKKRNSKINENMKTLIEKTKCNKCGGDLKQSRSGSYVAYCTDCGARYKAGKKK